MTASAPVGSDPLGVPFFYFRSNSTDWGVDEGSRLYPTGVQNVYARTISYSLGYDDSATSPKPSPRGMSRSLLNS